MAKSDVSTVELGDDEVARLEFLRYHELLAKQAEIGKELDQLKAKFRQRIGNNHQATIYGEVVFTYAPINRFAAGDFAKDHPMLAKEYTRPVVTDELDVEALKAAHPALYAQYQVRQFSTKKV